MGGPLPWQQNQLTDAHYHKGSHPIEDAQVLDTEDHVVQEERHQATEANAGNPEEGQEHWAGQEAQGMEWGDPTEHRHRHIMGLEGPKPGTICEANSSALNA